MLRSQQRCPRTTRVKAPPELAGNSIRVPTPNVGLLEPQVQVCDVIGRVEVVDDHTASALRVIDHFDRLVEEQATTAAAIRATAVMAGCPAGLHDAGPGLVRRFAPSGRSHPGARESFQLSAPRSAGMTRRSATSTACTRKIIPTLAPGSSLCLATHLS